MNRVARALLVHEYLERIRDRWVIVVSVLFALLASAVSLYGRSADIDAAKLTGPSLITLASLVVPLVALILSHDAIVGERERNTLGLLLSLPVSRIEVLMAKFLGRAGALATAVFLGLGGAMVVSEPPAVQALLKLMTPTLLLGLAFLSIGMLISVFARRQVTAASIVVVVWFGLVFFYDLGLLGLLIVSDGAVSQDMIARLVLANPAGLDRIQMMQSVAGPEVLRDLGMSVALPGPGIIASIWLAWLALPVAASGLLMSRGQVD
jgi:Cu-processing system permease protein